jgi:hypothetical protein
LGDAYQRGSTQRPIIMLRVVALPRAIAAGVAGAAVIEGVTLAAAKAGLPTIDLVSQLSATHFHRIPALGIAAALIAHFAIGICWAVFYAFSFGDASTCGRRSRASCSPSCRRRSPS